MLTNVPETDYLILQQMDDESLVQFCQTSEYATSLCLIPNIEKRLKLYKSYLEFDILDIDDYPFEFKLKFSDTNAAVARLRAFAPPLFLEYRIVVMNLQRDVSAWAKIV